MLPPSGLPTHDGSDLLNVKVKLAVFRPCAPPGQVLVLVEVLEEGWLTDELLLLAHPLAGASGLCQPDLQSAEGRPHHLSMAKVLRNHTGKRQFLLLQLQRSTSQMHCWCDINGQSFVTFGS